MDGRANRLMDRKLVGVSGYLFVYLSICLSVNLSICLFVYLSICLSVCLSVYRSVFLFICLSICLSISLPRYWVSDLSRITYPKVVSIMRGLWGKLGQRHNLSQQIEAWTCGCAICGYQRLKLVSRNSMRFPLLFGHFFFSPSASERRVLLIVGVCQTFSHLHSTSSLHICSSSHLLIFSSSHLLIFTSSHLHIFSSSHLHICPSSHPHIFTSSYLPIISCPLVLLPSCSLALLLSPSFLFLS